MKVKLEYYCEFAVEIEVDLDEWMNPPKTLAELADNVNDSGEAYEYAPELLESTADGTPFVSHRWECVDSGVRIPFGEYDREPINDQPTPKACHNAMVIGGKIDSDFVEGV